MAYSDKEYKDATQIAYLTFLKKTEKSLGIENSPYTIEELVKEYMDLDYAEETARILNPGRKNFTIKELIEYSDLKTSEKETLLGISDDAFNWKLISTHDTNSKNGFYGCVLETDDNNAIVAFRGSESLSNYKNLPSDWAEADAALLLDDVTLQESESEKFADKLLSKGILDKYENISVTGHSLGGELASHFTVYCAESQTELFNKIDKCVNMDGPGHSTGYIKEHEEGIKTASSKIIHYKWSPVGDALLSLPGEDIVYLEVADQSKELNYLSNLAYEIIGRHSTKSLIFDKDGNAIRGEQCSYANKFQKVTELIDALGLGLFAYSFIQFVVYDVLKQNGDGSVGLTPYGTALVGVGALAVILSLIAFPGFREWVINKITKILVAIAIGTAIDIWDKYGNQIILIITNELKKVCNDFSKTIDDVKYNLLKSWQSLKNTFYIRNNLGYNSYITENPYICVDTDLLRNYADRLSSLNSRIKNINSRMKNLYLNVGLKDLLNLIQADIVANYNYKIELCKNYLYNTADIFDNTENNIIAAFQ